MSIVYLMPLCRGLLRGIESTFIILNILVYSFLLVLHRSLLRGIEPTLVKYSCPVATCLNFFLYCIKRIKVVRGWVSKDILRQKVHLEI